MVPLLVRSHFSLMRGTTPVRRLCQAARQRGYRQLALTDTDNLCGLPSFLAACAEEGLRPIVGAEVTDPAAGGRAICLVESAAGYTNLCQLLTCRQLGTLLTEQAPGALAPGSAAAGPPFDLRAAVIRFGAGLTVLTDAPELLAAWHAAGLTVGAALPRQPGVAPIALRELARRRRIPRVALPDSVLLDPADYEAHRTLRAIAQNTTLSRLAPETLAPADAWLPPHAELAHRFAAEPEALAASERVAERCAFAGPEPALVLPPWHDPRGRPAAAALREAAFAGARWRYGDDLSEAAVERLEYELRRIEQKGFSAYFLVVQQIVTRSPRICGRGSGAASLVAYCLGITNVCPLKHELYFERFLNPARSDPPDIDVDFAWDERDDVLGWVLARYHGHAALVCSHVVFQPRMAIREVAKVFGLPAREIAQLGRRLPWFWQDEQAQGDLQARLQALPELKALDFAEPWPAILALAQRILGAPRYLSVHPGGVVITPRPIEQIVPVQQAAKGVPIIQWDKDAAEEGGLVKIDLLGNRSLAVIRDAVANLQRNRVPFCEERWEPEDDPRTQALVASGQTMGCFYIESPATRLLARRAGVGDFEHLVIHSSIIRPAANDCIREYLRRLKGGAWEPLHPLLADVLDETYGIMVYQEDVSKVAVALAGFSHADADGLRKILTKKDRERRLRDYQERFFSGARARGVSEPQIEQVWQMMLSFDGYSFCKPHSASYARVSFQAAWLKAHCPAEFLAAVISNGGGFYGTFAYVSEARRWGLSVLPPDVRVSLPRWSGGGRVLLAGLLAVKGLGGATQRRIVTAREQAPFVGFEDFLRRVQPDEVEARALILCGACDGLAPAEEQEVAATAVGATAADRSQRPRQAGQPRVTANGEGERSRSAAQLSAQAARRAGQLWQLARFQQVRRRERGGGQRSGELFAAADAVPAPRFPPAAPQQTLRRELEVLGFLCDRHPLALFAAALARSRRVPVVELERHVGRRVQVAGWLIAGKVVATKRGEPMEFLTFEDESGLVETTFFPDAYRRLCDRLDGGRPYLLAGIVEEEHGALTLTVDQARPLA